MSGEPHVELLSAYLDGVLPAEEREAVDAHLAVCDTCRRRLQTLRALRHAIARLPSRDEPPGAVRAHVDALRFTHRARWRRPVLWGSLVAAAALIAVATAVRVLAPPPRMAHELADEFVIDHLKSVPDARPAEVVSNDPRQVRGFFAGHVAFSPVAPALPGTRLVGGRVCRIAGERGQLLFYRTEAQTQANGRPRGNEQTGNEQTLSLFVSTAPFQAAGCDATRGHQVCGRTIGNLKLVLVGALPESTLSRLLENAGL
jgi:anti-sigma factor RsiW